MCFVVFFILIIWRATEGRTHSPPIMKELPKFVIVFTKHNVFLLFKFLCNLSFKGKRVTLLCIFPTADKQLKLPTHKCKLKSHKVGARSLFTWEY